MQESENLTIGNKIITSISMTEEQLEMLDLISLCNEDSRSATITRMIVERNDIDQSIQKIAGRIVANYSKKNIDFEGFVKAARSWLVQKKISAYYSERIIDEVKKIYAAE